MFTGFTPETIDFLWGIRMNNNKEWFTANKKQYKMRRLWPYMNWVLLFQVFLSSLKSMKRARMKESSWRLTCHERL